MTCSYVFLYGFEGLFLLNTKILSFLMKLSFPGTKMMKGPSIFRELTTSFSVWQQLCCFSWKQLCATMLKQTEKKGL